MNHTMLKPPAPSEEMRIVPLQPMYRGALTRKDAALYLGVCPATVTVLKQKGKLKCTSYGTYPVTVLNLHLLTETKRGRK